jgi:hypothetical protein
MRRPFPVIIRKRHRAAADQRGSWRVGKKNQRPPSRADAIKANNKKIARLRRAGADVLADKLAGCVAGRECHSDACLVSEHALQLATVEFYRLRSDATHYLSVVPYYAAVNVGHLREVDVLTRFRTDLDSVLAEGGVEYAIGAFHFDLVEGHCRRAVSFWQPHAHLLIKVPDKKGLRKRLLTKFPSRKFNCEIPIRLSTFNGDVRCLAYALDHHRNKLQFYPPDGGRAQHKRLRTAHLTELDLFLDELGAGGRVFWFEREEDVM